MKNKNILNDEAVEIFSGFVDGVVERESYTKFKSSLEGSGYQKESDHSMPGKNIKGYKKDTKEK